MVERLGEARAIVAATPAEETPLTLDECVTVANHLIGYGDDALRYAVYLALHERYNHAK